MNRRIKIPDDGVIVEVGSGTGEDTPTLAAKVPKGTVYAFEPNPDKFEKLDAATKGLKNVTAVATGLCNAVGKGEVHKDGSIHLTNHGEIPMMPLDFACKKMKRLDLIIVHPKEWHLLVLKGAQDTIEKFRPKIIAD